MHGRALPSNALSDFYEKCELVGINMDNVAIDCIELRLEKTMFWNDIKNNHELRKAYEFLRFAEENAMTDNEFVAELKREIRKYQNAEPKRMEKLVKDNGIDGYVLLIELPEHVRSNDEAEQYFLNNEYMEYEWFPWDCTGQLFTSWYKLFVRNGKWMAYHSVCRDI